MSLTTEVHRWSTREVPLTRRFDYFAEALASSLLPMRVSAQSPDRFDLELDAVEIGPISVALIGGSAHRAVRTPLEVERSAAHTFHLVVALTRPCQLQHRNLIVLQPGDATLVDSRYGHDFTLSEGHQNLNLTLSADWLRQWLPTPDGMVGRTLPRESGWVRALAAFAAGLTPEFVTRSPLPRSVLADHLGALLALTASDLSVSGPHVERADRSLSRRIRDLVRQRATEPSVCAAEIAQAAGISLRTLHRTLATGGETFAELLMATRCAHAVRMLESPLLDRLAIEEIGRRAGFVDPSHFARVLRRRVGETPRQIRHRRRSGNDQER